MIKKIIVLGMFLVMAFAFAGCAGDGDLTGLGRFEGLDPEIELQIIKAYFGEDYKGQESIDQKVIIGYYGTYNDSVVININIWGGWQFGFREEIVEEILFVSIYDVALWKDGLFYRLQEAYDLSFLTKENLEQIAARNREVYPNFYIAD